jgi:hypothetical protein
MLITMAFCDSKPEGAPKGHCTWRVMLAFADGEECGDYSQCKKMHVGLKLCSFCCVPSLHIAFHTIW